MSRSANSLRISDVTTTPIKLKYTSSYDCHTAVGAGIEVLTGVNGLVTVTGSVPQETLNYRSVRQLFYSNYISGSYPTTGSSFDNFLQSTAAYGTPDADVRIFPTESNAVVRVISIPRDLFGEKISRNSLRISSSAFFIVDDGNGNLIDGAGLPYVDGQYYLPEYTDWYVYGPPAHVGNVLYRQGIAIITNPDYIDALPYTPTANPDVATFTTLDNTKVVNILTNDSANSGVLVPGSVRLFGNDVASFTNNLNGTVTLNTNVIGTYTTNYTVDNEFDGCGLTSNVAQVTVNIIKPPCICETYRVELIANVPSYSFTYVPCSTDTLETAIILSDDNIIEVCVCTGQIYYDENYFDVTYLGTGCTADCTITGVAAPYINCGTLTGTALTVQPTTTTSTTTTTTTTLECTYYYLSARERADTGRFVYNDCTTNDLTQISITGTSPKYICAKTGTVYLIEGTGTATPMGACPPTTTTTTTTTTTSTTTTTTTVLAPYTFTFCYAASNATDACNCTELPPP